MIFSYSHPHLIAKFSLFGKFVHFAASPKKAMGLVHSLTGADHLSAIATLSVNVGNFRAFWLGVHWGMGHSIGLVLIGSIFIVIENLHYNSKNMDENADENDSSSSSRVIEVPKLLENIAACFVGIFMLALGFYNFYWAQRRRRHHCHHHHCEHNHSNHEDEEMKGKLSCDSLTGKTASVSLEDNENNDFRSPFKPQSSTSLESSRPPSLTAADRSFSKKFLSLWIGIFHGVAGPGGVLGVVPAVRLHNLWYSIAYLGSFCASSIFAMGCFAAVYGSLSANWSQDNDRLSYGMEIFSASLSLLVGCTWLILLYLGVLDEVFP